jgi:hypothetical protein
MNKPVFGLRKPPESEPASPTQLAAFIHGVPAPPEAPIAARAVIVRADGRQRRRMTVYLPPALAKKLAVHCSERDQEMSNVVAMALEQFFARE